MIRRGIKSLFVNGGAGELSCFIVEVGSKGRCPKHPIEGYTVLGAHFISINFMGAHVNLDIFRGSICQLLWEGCMSLENFVEGYFSVIDLVHS